ncbi:Mitochondrial intermediate peptidase [Tulasnella sp. 419]|nr:Mitochondrial intermediate peptidase [Tulasnella sp. 419]
MIGARRTVLTSVSHGSRTHSLLDFRRGLQSTRHKLAAVVGATQVPPVVAASHSDVDITPFFDHPRLSSGSHIATPYSSIPKSHQWTGKQTGLFGQAELGSPQEFLQLADRTVNRARLLVDRICKSRQDRREMSKVVKNLDRLSDMLCVVIDAAELIRHVHPDRAWVEAANMAYENLCSYMNVLNTNVDLYEVLSAVMNDREISSSFTYEQRQTALIFLRDFERSGIHLPPDARHSFVSLSDDIITLGREFTHPSTSTASSVKITTRDLEGLPLRAKAHIASRANFRGKIKVTPGSWEAIMLSKHSPNEELRKELYVADLKMDKDRVTVLENLLRARDQLARLLGKPSFAAWTLEDKMAKTTDNVLYFLRSLAEYQRPLAHAEIQRLANLKQTHLGLPSTPIVDAWDRDFYSTRLEAQSRDPALGESTPLFSAGSVFQALSRLFSRIYGLRLVPKDVLTGETWHPEVKKLEVVDESEGVIGIIYVDLWARAGKHSGAAHYTVRCSRRIDDDDVEGDFQSPFGQQLRESGQAEIPTNNGATFPSKKGVFQLPIAALVCEFEPSSSSKVMSALTWPEVSTLFHEMGHAMHSMIGRTEYHNVSGTRCSTDFVELPSILMEKFLASPAVLSLFPSNPSAPIPSHPELLQQIRRITPLPSLDTHAQILLATLDQVYHSPIVSSPNFSSTTELHKLQDTLGLFPSVPNTAWQIHFGHLYGYGATYYSYLFDRAIARKVWRTIFEKDPLSRESGERYKNEVLKFGGGKDPWQMIGQLLNLPEVEGGDIKAMEAVGRWGADE